MISILNYNNRVRHPSQGCLQCKGLYELYNVHSSILLYLQVLSGLLHVLVLLSQLLKLLLGGAELRLEVLFPGLYYPDTPGQGPDHLHTVLELFFADKTINLYYDPLSVTKNMFHTIIFTSLYFLFFMNSIKSNLL